MNISGFGVMFGSHRQYKHPLRKGRVTVSGKPSDDLAPGTVNSIYKQAGAPLSALGIRALWELLAENLVLLVLEKANGHLWKERYRLQDQRCLPLQDK